MTQFSSLLLDEDRNRAFLENEKQKLEEEIVALKRLVTQLQDTLETEKERWR